MFSCAFFFQAEDGIRDWSVTGVQTCALPIWFFGRKDDAAGDRPWRDCRRGHGGDGGGFVHPSQCSGNEALTRKGACSRSEERRVGKECKSGVRPCECTERERRGSRSEARRRW